MLQLFVNGLVLGSILALTAIGLSMTYSILNFANFAHGDFLALGAYLTFVFSAILGVHFIPASAIAVVITAFSCVLRLCNLEANA